MATVLRPPLVSQRQPVRPLPRVDVYPNLLQTTLTPSGYQTPPVSCEFGGVLPRYNVQLDVYPNLLETTLKPVQAVLGLPLLAARESDSAPVWRSFQSGQPLQRPELTLGIAAPAVLGLPLTAARLHASSPPPKVAVRFEPPGNPVVLQPIPKVLRWDSPATPLKPPPQVDVYPNLLAGTLKPIPAVLSMPLLSVRWSAEAPVGPPAPEVLMTPNPVIWGVPLPPAPVVVKGARARTTIIGASRRQIIIPESASRRIH